MRSVAQMMQGCTDWYNSEQEKPTKTHKSRILRINQGLMKPYTSTDPIGSINSISFPALAFHKRSYFDFDITQPMKWALNTPWFLNQ